jgi:predicted ABC-type transport system involved in lysophospholipase L1 biosynthesis ATPase subunit
MTLSTTLVPGPDTTGPATVGTATAGTATAAARAVGVTKLYGAGDASVAALDDVTVDLDRGRFTAIMGPSGSGKSTLLHVLAGLDRPTSGEVYLGDTELTSLRDKRLTMLRRDRIGFVFQSFNLLPTMTAAENIVLPMRIAGRRPDPDWVASIVETVGLGDRLGHRPAQLSGGQQQRRAPWRPAQRSSSPTSPRAHSTRGPGPSCSASSAPRWTSSPRPSSWSRTTRRPRHTPTGSCSSPTAGSPTRCTARPLTTSSTT